MPSAAREQLFAEAVQSHMGIFLKMTYAFSLPADRDDLLQELLLAAWLALPAFDGSCKLSTFLYRVTNNRALNWRRTSLRYRRRLDALAAHPQLTLDAAHPGSPDHRLEWLYRTIQALDPLDRTILLLQLEHLAHTEIAEITGLTANNVGVRLHRIRRWLAEQKEDTHET